MPTNCTKHEVEKKVTTSTTGFRLKLSQYRLSKANGKPDLTPQRHADEEHTLNFGFAIELPIFNRNQGEFAQTRYTINQSPKLASETSQ